MKAPFFLAVSASVLLASHAFGAEAEDVKSYLVSTVTKMKAASADFVKNSAAYAELVQKDGGIPQAWAKDKAEVQKLVAAMQENYKAMDSFGYETVEGIVAGVEKLAHYDVYLDAGLPKGEGAPEETSPVKLTLADGTVVEGEGSSFTYLIEPTLWGGNKKWTVPVDLNGDGTLAPRESLPKPELLVAVAQDTDAKIGSLLADSQAWQPSSKDLFEAMVAMTPTLSDYFEDWKESRYSEATSGRFYAVSRLSDMTGIMKSCAVMYRAVKSEIAPKDKALAKTIDAGFKDIFTFLEGLEKREKKSEGGMKPAVIDEMANQAKARTDKLVPQIKQAAALVGVQVAG